MALRSQNDTTLSDFVLTSSQSWYTGGRAARTDTNSHTISSRVGCHNPHTTRRKEFEHTRHTARMSMRIGSIKAERHGPRLT